MPDLIIHLDALGLRRGGIIALTRGSVALEPRILQAGDGITITNPSGAAGDPTIAVNALSGVNPIGTVVDYAGATAPTGWLLCYGQAISRTTYADLFDVLSTTYGAGDGSTTFNLPDLRGRVVAGQDDMGGSSANRLTGASGGVNGDTLGGTGGAETHVLTTTEMPAHTHAVGFTDQATAGGVANTVGGTDGSVNTGSAGSDGAHNNVQPTIILNKIIFAGL